MWPAPRPLVTFFADEADAKRRLYLLGYRDVMTMLGKPETVFSPGGLQVNWVYPTGVVLFTDGLAANVTIKSK